MSELGVICKRFAELQIPCSQRSPQLPEMQTVEILRTRNLQFRKPLANHTKLTHISSQKEAICCEVGKSLKIRGLNLAVGGTLLLYWCVPAANKFKG
jgi:hypothetical protein